MARQDVGQRRHAGAAELIGVPLHNRPAQGGRSIEQAIVMNDHDAVARKMHVELESVGPEAKSILERRHRVLGRQRAAAAMRKDQRSGRLEKWMTLPNQQSAITNQQFQS